MAAGAATLAPMSGDQGAAAEALPFATVARPAGSGGLSPRHVAASALAGDRELVLPEIDPRRVALTQQPSTGSPSIVRHRLAAERDNNPYRQPPPGQMFRCLDEHKNRQLQMRRGKRAGPVAAKMTVSTDAKKKKSFVVRRKERKDEQDEEEPVRFPSSGSQPGGAAGGDDEEQNFIELTDEEDESDDDSDDEAALAFAEKQLTSALHGKLPLSLKEGKTIDRERLVDFVQKKRDVFHLEFAIKIKQDEIEKLKQIVRAEDARLDAKQVQLQTDDALLAQFLKENERAAVEAVKYADEVSRDKQDLLSKVKKTRASIASIIAEIDKSDDQVCTYLDYANFLERVSPKEWRETMIAKRKALAEELVRRQQRIAYAANNPVGETQAFLEANGLANASPQVQRKALATMAASGLHDNNTGGHGNLRKAALSHAMAAHGMKSAGGGGGGGGVGGREVGVAAQASPALHRGHQQPAHSRHTKSRPPPDGVSATHVAGGEGSAPTEATPEMYETMTLLLDPSEEAELYFDSPTQLLDVYTELEERNLSLIQNGQDTEEVLETLKSKIVKFEKKMSTQLATMGERVLQLRCRIHDEEDAIQDMKLKMKMFSHRDSEGHEIDIQDDLTQLEAKIKQVFTKCIGGKDSNITSVQMLTGIETRLHDLFDAMERMPPIQLQEGERMKEKERRQRAKDEIKVAEKKMQEQRIARALARAKAAPKKQLGRRAVFRSNPPAQADDKDSGEKLADPMEEEHRLFFS